MSKSTNIRVLVSLIASAFILASCDREQPEPEQAAVLSSKESVLKYIPADTPYVLASVEPLPDELMDKIEPKIDQVLQAYQSILRAVVTAKQREMPEDERGNDASKRIAAIVDELTTLLSLEGLRSAGITREASGAIYGNGLLPVLRLELTDGALLDSAIARLEEKAGQKLPVAAIEGGGYRFVELDEFRLVIAIIADQAVVTMVPGSFDADQIADAIGLTPPETSIADTGALARIADEYSFTPHYIGFIDVPAIASTFIDPQTGTNAALLAMGQPETANLSDVCKQEIRSIASVVPRIVTGYTQVNDERLDSAFVVELREDIASGMALLPAPVPGLGDDQGGLMSFGLSLDMKGAREFVEKRVEALEAEPFKCEQLAGIQQGIAGMRQGLNQPIPPIFYDFKGFLAVIDKLEGLDLESQTPPEAVEGRFLLAIDNAQALVALGAMFSPELAELNLQSDGVPVALDLPQTQGMGISAFAAMTDNAIAIATGEGADAGLKAMLKAETADPSPFLSFSMDAARYYEFLGEAVAVADDGEAEEATPPELKAAVQEIMTAVSSLYDRMTALVFLTSKGVEIRSSVSLKD
jgi:hypothetical protein